MDNSPEKDLGITSVESAKERINDIIIFGDGNNFQLISKVSSVEQGWMKSTKGFDIGVGVLVQVTTQQKNPDGSYALAEALTFVPGVTLVGGGENVKVVPRW